MCGGGGSLSAYHLNASEGNLRRWVCKGTRVTTHIPDLRRYNEDQDLLHTCNKSCMHEVCWISTRSWATRARPTMASHTASHGSQWSFTAVGTDGVLRCIGITILARE